MAKQHITMTQEEKYQLLADLRIKARTLLEHIETGETTENETDLNACMVDAYDLAVEIQRELKPASQSEA